MNRRQTHPSKGHAWPRKPQTMVGCPDAFEERVEGQFKEHVFAQGRCEVWPGVYAELLGSKGRPLPPAFGSNEWAESCEEAERCSK